MRYNVFKIYRGSFSSFGTASFEKKFVYINSDGQSNELIAQQSSSLSQLSLETTLPTINEAFSLLNESPILTKKKTSYIYLKNKVDQVTVNLKKTLGISEEHTPPHVFSVNDTLDIITRLKEKYHDENTCRKERIQILSLMPLSWSIQKTTDVMGATQWTAKTARKLVEKHGILCVPRAKIGKRLNNFSKYLLLNLKIRFERKF